MGAVRFIIPSGEYKQVNTFYFGNEIIGQMTTISLVTSSDRNVFG